MTYVALGKSLNFTDFLLFSLKKRNKTSYKRIAVKNQKIMHINNKSKVPKIYERLNKC